MLDLIHQQLRRDCLTAADAIPLLAGKLRGQHVCVVGGLGFAGTWLAEMVAALNDERDARSRLTLIGREPHKWLQQYPWLRRDDISLQAADVRSSFEFPRDTTLVIYAAGTADPRKQASEPHRVYQSILFGLDNALTAANRLESVQRFVNISSGLVAGGVDSTAAVTEAAIGVLDFKRLHNLYAEMRRAGEAMVSAYASQFRLPVSTVRAFTFLGPFQPQDAPWAVNSFIQDALAGHEIRVHGAGSSRRSYLYGSDVAAWLLQALVAGEDGEVYNFGGDEPVSHEQAARWVSERTTPTPRVLVRTGTGDDTRSRDFVPDLSQTRRRLGVRVTVAPQGAVARTLQWQADCMGVARRLRDDGHPA
ncbi:MAG: NAD(P)-dependent oxidoreductase [Alphaproteobacteria bacterium]|nr:MAG: NAD(P)-dependent oxidoreductase [Alphaproteobacteria bacterium]